MGSAAAKLLCPRYGVSSSRTGMPARYPVRRNAPGAVKELCLKYESFLGAFFQKSASVFFIRSVSSSSSAVRSVTSGTEFEFPAIAASSAGIAHFARSAARLDRREFSAIGEVEPRPFSFDRVICAADAVFASILDKDVAGTDKIERNAVLCALIAQGLYPLIAAGAHTVVIFAVGDNVPDLTGRKDVFEVYF